MVACSSSENLNGYSPIELTSSHIDAWLNMMPGTSPGTFHIIGEIALQNNSETELDSMEMSNITVYCDSEVVYTFKPKFESEPGDNDPFFKPGTNKIFRIRTGKGLNINETIIRYKKINLKLNFITNLGEQFFEIKNIKVERAY